MHKHKFKLEKETSIFATNVRLWKCSCGKERQSFQPFGGKEYTYGKKIGEAIEVNWSKN